MKYTVEKETKELYYLKIRWGNLYRWGSQKTFVRIPYKKKDGTLGSKYYCSSKETAILFETKSDALKFEADYTTYGHISPITLPEGARLKEITVNGHKCLRVIKLYS